MEELKFRDRVKNATRRLSNRNSYTPETAMPSFKVKALCWEGIKVETMKNKTSNDAVDEVLSSIGSLTHKNKNDVILKISIRNGIEVYTRKNKTKPIYAYKIHNVGYCNVDKRYPQIFVFIAGENINCLKCHIFLCDDINKSRAICLTLAKAFESSYENWKKSKEMKSDIIDLKKLENRRRSEDLVLSPSRLRLEKRRASDFINVKSLSMRRNSTGEDSVGSSEEGSIDQAFGSLSKETKNPLRRQSTDWQAFENDEEIKRKMEGDLILWE